MSLQLLGAYDSDEEPAPALTLALSAAPNPNPNPRPSSNPNPSSNPSNSPRPRVLEQGSSAPDAARAALLRPPQLRRPNIVTEDRPQLAPAHKLKAKAGEAGSRAKESEGSREAGLHVNNSEESSSKRAKVE